MRSCPHCETNLDGDLVIATFLDNGGSESEAIENAKSYVGWEEWGVENRWKKEIGIYDLDTDRTTHYVCPNCRKKV